MDDAAGDRRQGAVAGRDRRAGGVATRRRAAAAGDRRGGARRRDPRVLPERRAAPPRRHPRRVRGSAHPARRARGRGGLRDRDHALDRSFASGSWRSPPRRRRPIPCRPSRSTSRSAAATSTTRCTATCSGSRRAAPATPSRSSPSLGLTVTKVREAGGGHTQLVLKRRLDVLDGIAFGWPELSREVHEGDVIDVVAQLRSRRFGGIESLQLEIRDAALSGSSPGIAGDPRRRAGGGRAGRRDSAAALRRPSFLPPTCDARQPEAPGTATVGRSQAPCRHRARAVGGRSRRSSRS